MVFIHRFLHKTGFTALWNSHVSKALECHYILQGKKSLFHGQGSENDSGVSRNLCDAITSSRNDNTAEAIQDESSTVSHRELLIFILSNAGSELLQLLSVMISIELI